MSQAGIADRRELLEEKLAGLQYQEQVVLKELEALKLECRHPGRTPSVRSAGTACPDCGAGISSIFEKKDQQKA